ncbi:uncharacterized protein LOC109812045 isoform X2 [Cajanus cajan]|uniref:uncharacterized protein LOC109812045 isoform X2 n=1 Tax=Cajanus cajan TaxID=3821 RepID=UPI00098DA017|nr:uncharacterized protein LOC109812045 isoform X2 [Cajanus cajan]
MHEQKRNQANRNNRTKQKMPHTRGSKSIGTLMVEKAIDGIEPTRAEIFILTHQRRKDGRPLDDVSAKIVVFGTNIGQEKAPEMPHMSFGAHESQLPTKSTATMKTEANKNSMVQAGNLTSLLKLLRKDNDKVVRILAAKAIANVSMNEL